jgi:hypothetical protein
VARDQFFIGAALPGHMLAPGESDGLGQRLTFVQDLNSSSRS